MAAPSLPAAPCPPAAERTPVGEEGSSAGRASSPEDSVTFYAAQEPRPVPAQVGPIEEEICCLLLLSSFAVSVSVRSSKQEEAVVHIHLKVLHGLEVHLVIKEK